MYGFTDSKVLTEEERDHLFHEMKLIQYDQLGFFTDVLNADLLSHKMLAEQRSGGKNLNVLSHDSAIALINKVRKLGFKVRKVILDTVGDPESYKSLIK